MSSEKSIIKHLPLEKLNIYNEYQRHTEGSVLSDHVKQIAKNWTRDLLDPLIACPAGDGMYEVVDGGNRWLAAKLRKGVTLLPCRIVPASSVRKQARLFLLSNANRKSVTAYDMHIAGLAAKDDMALLIKDIVDSGGYAVSKFTGPHRFTAIVALRKLVKSDAGKARETFQACSDICDPDNISHRMLKAIYTLLLDSKPLTQANIDKLRLAGRVKIEQAIDKEVYEAPKNSNGAKVYAKAVRQILRCRRIK